MAETNKNVIFQPIFHDKVGNIVGIFNPKKGGGAHGASPKTFRFSEIKKMLIEHAQTVIVNLPISSASLGVR